MAPAQIAPGLFPNVKNRARQVCRARFPTAKAKTPRRRLIEGGDGAAHQCLMRFGNQRPLTRARFSCARHGGRCAGARCTLLRPVVQKRAVLDAGGGCPGHHAGLFTDMPHGLAMTNPCHTSNRPPQDAGSVPACRKGQTLPASACVPAKPSCGAPSRPSLHSGQFGPLRPWFVVNPGGGTAAPRASWLQPSGTNNFPCAARIPRAANSLRLPVLHDVAAASGAASPSPADRITTRTR